MRSGRWFLGVVALLAAARAGADNPAPSPSPVPALPTPPPLVAVNPPAPAPQAARGPEALRLFGRLDDDRSAVYIASGPPDARVSRAMSGLAPDARDLDLSRAPHARKERAHPVLSRIADGLVPLLDRARRGARSPCAVRQGNPGGARGQSRSLRRRAPRRLGGQGHLAAPGRQQRRPRGARGPRRAAHPPSGRREAGGAGTPARLEQAAHGEGAQEAHARHCPTSTASSSRTSSRSSRTSSATRCSSSARTTSASISSKTSGSAARWRRTASASPSATSTKCGSSRPRSASGTSTRTRGASTS